jgi:UV DNA damage endonuclease
MSLGVCCQWMEEKKSRTGTSKWVNALEERNLQYGAFLNGKYTHQQIIDVYTNNLDNIRNKLPSIIEQGIRSFRISSNILPLIDRVPDEVRYAPKVLNSLAALGKVILENKIRFTVHPDQFCVITSKNPDVIKNSFQILEHHAWIFDQLGLPQNNYYAINIHGGVKNQFALLVDSINKLPNNVRSRLTLENEELAYSVEDLYTVHKETGISIVFDSHHHKFNPGNLLGHEAMELAMSTWKEKPLTHLSNTEPELENAKFQDRRKHSNYVHHIPAYQHEANNAGKIDIDFEFKMKNEAIFKAVKEFGINL